MRRLALIRHVLLIALISAITLAAAASPAHAGQFTTEYCGSNASGNGEASLDQGLGPGGRGTGVWVGHRCPDSGSGNLNEGWYSRVKGCDEDAAFTFISGTDACLHSASVSGAFNRHNWTAPADPNVWINDVIAYRGMRTTACKPNTSCTQKVNGSIGYEFYTYGGADAPNAFGGVHAFEGCATARQAECIRGSGLEDLVQYNTNTMTGGTNPTPRRLSWWLSCSNPSYSNYCVHYRTGFIDYLARYNIRRLQLTVQDNGAPGFGNGAASWDQNCWYTSGGQSACGNVGSFRLSGDASDTTGIRAWGVYSNGNLRGNGTYGCSQWPNGFYTNMRPCSSQTLAWDSWSLQEGANALRLDAADPAGNVGSLGATLQIDNSQPSPQPVQACTTDPCGGTSTIPIPSCVNGDGVTITQAGPVAATPNWLRGTVTVRAAACDGQSGIQSGKVEFSTNGGGSWQDAPNCAMPAAAPAQPSRVDCNFDTTPYGQNTPIRFRANAQNRAAIWQASNSTGDYRIDNTPPPNPALHFKRVAPTGQGTLEIDQYPGTGWTNAKTAQAYWAAVSDGTGSGVEPANGIEYVYDPDMETGAYAGRPGNCAPLGTTSAARKLPGASTSVNLDQDRTDECRQGTHQFWFRVSDRAGNWSAWTTNTFNYDSYPTAETKNAAWACAGKYATSNCFRPRSLTLDPTTWTTTNSFTLRWQNAQYNGVTESPIREALIRGPFNFPSRVNSNAEDVGLWRGCTGNDVTCTLSGLSVTPAVGGSYPLKVWLRDSAGNADEEQSAAATINYQDNQCIRPTG